MVKRNLPEYSTFARMWQVCYTHSNGVEAKLS